MIHLAAQALRARPASFVGTLVALVLAAVLTTSSGILIETALRTDQRLLLAVATSFGGFAVLIAIVVVWGTLSLTVATRRQELATLRALGAVPGQVLALVAGEALILAAAAVAVGTPAAVTLARVLLERLARLDVVTPDVTLHPGLLSLLAGAAVTLAAAVLSGAAAAIGPAWSPPVVTMTEPATARRAEPAAWRTRAGVGLLMLGVSSSLMPLVLPNDVGAAGTGSAALLLVLAVVAFGPRVTRPLLTLLTRPLSRMGVGGYLAGESVAADPRRQGAVATPMILAIGFTLTMVHTQAGLAEAATRQVERGVIADAVVAVTSGAQVRELRALPGVASVVPTASQALVVPQQFFGEDEPVHVAARVLGARPADIATVLDPGVAAGRLTDLSGATIALDTSLARMLRVRVGDVVPVLPDSPDDPGAQQTARPVGLRLVATYDRGLGIGSALIPMGAVPGGGRADLTALVAAAEGVQAATLTSTLDTFAAQHPGVQVQDRAELVRTSRAESLQAAWVNLLGLGVVLIYLAIAVVNSLVISTAARRHEVALLRLIGATRRQVLTAALAEAMIGVTLAVILGIAIAAPPLAGLSIGLLGSPVPAGPPWILVTLAAGVTVLALAATGLPTWWSLHSLRRAGRC